MALGTVSYEGLSGFSPLYLTAGFLRAGSTVSYSSLDPQGLVHSRC